jgi:hypothetical protein
MFMCMYAHVVCATTWVRTRHSINLKPKSVHARTRAPLGLSSNPQNAARMHIHVHTFMYAADKQRHGAHIPRGLKNRRNPAHCSGACDARTSGRGWPFSSFELRRARRSTKARSGLRPEGFSYIKKCPRLTARRQNLQQIFIFGSKKWALYE